MSNFVTARKPLENKCFAMYLRGASAEDCPKGLTNFVTAGMACEQATRRNPRKTVGFELGTPLELAQSVATMRQGTPVPAVL